jgi:hypothetical protein
MRIKTDEWKANAEDWDALSDVDHITISSTAALPKRPHVEEPAKRRARGRGRVADLPGLIRLSVSTPPRARAPGRFS